MRWDVLFLILTVGLSGCTQNATLVKDGVGVHLKDVVWDISSLTEGIWKVGRTYRDTVSKNLNVVVTLPRLDDSDEDFLSQTYGVDAWLVRVIQSNSQGSRIELATIYAPFRAQQKGRASNLHVKAISFTLTYAASAISERFRKFQCPAFSHSLRLDEYDVSGKKEPMQILLRADAPFNEKLTMGELVPTSLNIGNTMVGEYFLETALFSTSKKQTFSSFSRIPMSVKVLTEKSVSVDGCAGVHSEYEPAN